MGHEIMHFDYPENINKKEVEVGLNEYVSHATWQEGGGGLYSPIKWIDKTFDSYGEAREYIRKIDTYNYDQLAVKYLEYPTLKYSKTYDVLKERVERLNSRYNELRNNIHYKGVKSALVTCRNCDSKIATKYIGQTVYNNCPICKADLRPQSTLDLIGKAKENADKTSKDLAIEEKKLREKQKKNAKTRWLVKIEYHV